MSRPAAATPGPSRFPPGERGAAALVLGAAFMLLADTSIVNLAVPSIQRELAASVPDVQLMVAGYQVAYAVLLITGGRLGDLWGRQRMFAVGAASFTLASLACGLAQGPEQLIAGRVWQGLSASLLYPQVIATLHLAVAPERRARAFAWLGAVVSSATIAGPIIAGLLIAADVAGSGWRPIFLVNVPVGVVLVALAPRLVPENRGRRSRLDLAGTLTVVVLLTALMVPLTIGRDAGWPAWGWALLLCVPPLAGLFLWLEAALERRGSAPLLRPGLWADPGFRLGLALYLVFFAGVVPFFLYYSIVLQFGLGYSTLAAAAAMVPYAVGTTIVSLRSAWFVATFTAPRTILAGCLVCAAGSVALLATVAANDSGERLALAMTPAMFLTGLGLGLVIGPLLGFVLSGVHTDDSGAVSGLLSTAQQIGASVGVALLGLAFFRGFTGDLVGLGYPLLQDSLTYALLVVVAAFGLASLLVGVIAHRSRTREEART